jgi:hypothetical protein
MKPIRIAVALGAAGLFLGAMAGPAFADDAALSTGSSATATASVIAGDRTATLAGPVAFGSALAAAHTDTALSPVSTDVVVNDLSASDAGWNVTIVAGDLTGPVNANTGVAVRIAAANLSVSSYGTLASSPGDMSNIKAGTPASIGTSIALLSAPVLSGMGDYTQPFYLGLVVPANSLAGAYSGTLTVTIVPAGV